MLIGDYHIWEICGNNMLEKKSNDEWNKKWPKPDDWMYFRGEMMVMKERTTTQ